MEVEERPTAPAEVPPDFPLVFPPAGRARVAAEWQALGELVSCLQTRPEEVWLRTARLAREWCRATSAGVCLVERSTAAEQVRYQAVAGDHTAWRGRVLPLAADPTGVVVAQRAPRTFRRPGVLFPALAEPPPLRLVLSVPLAGEPPAGAIWAATTGEALSRDAERKLERLAVLLAVTVAWQKEREQLRDAEAEVQRLRAEVQAAQDQFLALASHELRTPLTVIKSQVQLLLRRAKRGTLDQEQLVAGLETLEAATDRLVRLTTDLLDLAQLRQGDVPLRWEPLSLAALVQHAVATFQAAATDHRLVITRSEEPCLVQGDAVWLEHVVVHLLENAVKFSPAGTAVQVELSVVAGGLQLCIRDEGIGLPAGAAATLLQPFRRAPNAFDRQVPGLGLGLAIDHRVIERHGGRLWLESEGEDRGTRAYLWLPCAASADTRREADVPRPIL
ncbi:MAG: hypothetical protein KatS3mg061_0131 [Dehalococcoidia bacterium]|nr:MAG: hypothetical protein KatS3mg061_0131 [Dehalococcoidia bacterium]